MEAGAIGAICCQSTSGLLVLPQSDMDLQGAPQRWSSTKHLGHNDQNFAGIKIHPLVSSDAAMIRNAYFCAALHEQDHLTGVSVYKVLRCFYFHPCPSRAAYGHSGLTHSQSCWRVCGNVTGYDYRIMSIENQSSVPNCKK